MNMNKCKYILQSWSAEAATQCTGRLEKKNRFTIKITGVSSITKRPKIPPVLIR